MGENPRIICISDTHGVHENLRLPPCDLLIHAGDLTRRGTLRELARASRWLHSQPAERVVLIAGNHDRCLERSPVRSREILSQLDIYLEDEAFEWQGLKIYGSPWQPKFFNWAFNLPRGEPLREKWQMIPEDTDILVTHTPPYGVLDKTRFGQHVGCEELARRVAELDLKLHVFGHIHEDYGVRMRGSLMSLNASTCNLRYDPVQPPVELEYRDGTFVLLSGGVSV
jgi:Icc-related predicted phosphoesterase